MLLQTVPSLTTIAFDHSKVGQRGQLDTVGLDYHTRLVNPSKNVEKSQ